MKKFIFIVLASLFLLIGCSHAQTINSFKTRCASPYQSSFASGTAQLDGNINFVPCPTKSVQINGSAIPSGTGTTDRGAYWSSSTALSATALTYYPSALDVLSAGSTIAGYGGSASYPWTQGNSTIFQYAISGSNSAWNLRATRSGGDTQGFIVGGSATGVTTYAGIGGDSVNGTIYNLSNAQEWGQYTFTGRTNFQMVANWRSASGSARWRVGDFATTATRYLDLNYATSTFTAVSPTIILQDGNVNDNNKLSIVPSQIGIGDTEGNFNNTRILVGDDNQTIQIIANGGAFVLTGLGAYPTADFQTFAVKIGAQEGLAFDTTPACAGTGTIGAGGTVVVNTGCVVNTNALVLVTYTSAVGVAPAYVDTLVAGTSFTVHGSANAPFNYMVVNRY